MIVIDQTKLEKQGYFNFKYTEHKGWCALCNMLFTIGLCYHITDEDYYGRYCFPDLLEAKQALEEWNGENDPPGNWIKHKSPNGDISNPNYIKY